MQSTQQSLNPFSILNAAAKRWQKHFVKILLATVIVTIPGSFIRVFQFDSVNDASIIASLAGLYLCVALIWSFFNLDKVQKNSFLKLYVLSSKRFLPYLFASILFAIVCMPAVLSVVLLILSGSGQIGWVFFGFGILILLASLYLAIRFSLATSLVVQNEISAFNAMRLSWQVVSGHTMMVGLAWALAIFLVIFSSGVVFTLVNLSTTLASSAFVQLLLNGLLLSFLLPLFLAFAVELTTRLEQ